METPIVPEVQIFSDSETARLAGKTTLDETDRKILALIIVHPKWSNDDIGNEVGLNRIQVWRRRTRGPLATVLLEFQKEALDTAKDLVIEEARGAIEQLGKLCRGECDCSPMIKEQAENHRLVCLTPVPYAVRRAAAKDLIEILQSRRDENSQEEEEVWESVVSNVGGIQVKRITGNFPDQEQELPNA